MALKRGRDEKDFVKDIHDRARNIIAQGKEVPRVRMPVRTLTDSSVPFQYPLEKTGLNQKDIPFYSRRQAQRIKDASPFYKQEVPLNSNDNNTYGSSLYFNDKMMFS